MTKEELLPFCECGECGLRVTKPGNRFINGHNNRGITLSSERCAQMSAERIGVPHTTPAQLAADDARCGVPHSPEACAKMSADKLGKPRTSFAQIEADRAESEMLRGIPRTPEVCTKISEAKLGVPLSEEHCAAMSAVRLGVPRTSEAQIAADEAKRGVPLSPEHIAAVKKGLEDSGAIERMRGGNDLVRHHYIYDHSDLSKNMVQMTRSDHTRLHSLLRKLGYIVPHINMEGN